MRNYIIIALIGLLTFTLQAQSNETPGKFGLSLNTAFNGELPTPRIIPSVTYTKGKNQYDLGIGFQPFNLDQERLLSIELSEKHYINGMESKYNMYFISTASLVNIKRDTYYPATYNYLFLNTGYGFDVQPIPNFGLYLGTNMTIGMFTYSKQTDTPNDMFQSQKMFREFGYNLTLQANIGYRF
jgi:hypothetical protein